MTQSILKQQCGTQHNDTQHNETRHNKVLNNDPQRNDSHHNDTQDNNYVKTISVLQSASLNFNAPKSEAEDGGAVY